MSEQRFRIKATQANGATNLGDYMTPEVWERYYWPDRRDTEAREPWQPKQTLVPVDEVGAEILEPVRSMVLVAWAMSS